MGELGKALDWRILNATTLGESMNPRALNLRVTLGTHLNLRGILSPNPNPNRRGTLRVTLNRKGTLRVTLTRKGTLRVYLNLRGTRLKGILTPTLVSRHLPRHHHHCQ